jgi:hypothetical protein
MEKYLLNPVRPGAEAMRRRKKPRTHVFTIAALVSGVGLAEPLACTVRDISETGARLEVDRDPRHREEIASLPECITVYLCPRETSVECRVTWQDGAHFGVEFLEPLEPPKVRQS